MTSLRKESCYYQCTCYTCIHYSVNATVHKCALWLLVYHFFPTLQPRVILMCYVLKVILTNTCNKCYLQSTNKGGLRALMCMKSDEYTHQQTSKCILHIHHHSSHNYSISFSLSLTCTRWRKLLYSEKKHMMVSPRNVTVRWGYVGAKIRTHKRQFSLTWFNTCATNCPKLFVKSGQTKSCI